MNRPGLTTPALHGTPLSLRVPLRYVRGRPRLRAGRPAIGGAGPACRQRAPRRALYGSARGACRSYRERSITLWIPGDRGLMGTGGFMGAGGGQTEARQAVRRARQAVRQARGAAATPGDRGTLVREMFALPVRDCVYRCIGRPVS